MICLHNTKKSSIVVNNKKKASKKKQSHLYFQNKHLRNIPKFNEKENVLVLYLYDNKISNIDNLDGFPNLTSLYLQNNEIERIENLNHLLKLKDLFIGHNKICVLEGLEATKCLQELHIEKQDLADNSPLCIDPRTLICISETLHTLNISHNNITSLYYLAPLRKLRVINASFNDLDDIMDVCQTINKWHYLLEALFTGNPFTKRRHRYREEIIAHSHCLRILDGKHISEITRSFIRKFEEEKILHGSKPSINIADIYTSLPKNYPLSLQKAASASILKTPFVNLIDDLSTFDERNSTHIAWKTLPKRKSCMKKPKLQHVRNIEMQTYNKTVSSSTISFPQLYS